MSPRATTVAAIQVSSENGAPERNLANAAEYVARAVSAGAELVLCPEFLATGYAFEQSVWELAEPAGGRTERWLSELAAQHRIHVGASYLEAEGDDFYNTFTLMAPGGTLAGRVRKQSLPFFEGWFFKPCDRPKIIETSLGKLAVGICQDNQTAAFLEHMFDELPDLILMPHSAPTPLLPLIGGPIAKSFETQLGNVAARYARALGVPTILSNKVSAAPSSTALPIVPFVRVSWQFRGHSSVCDASGETLASIPAGEGIAVARVVLGGAKRPAARARASGYWSFAPDILPSATGALLIALDRMGRWSYGRNSRRRELARAMSRSVVGKSLNGDW
jgi:N-carbamoylputrescine amidase